MRWSVLFLSVALMIPAAAVAGERTITLAVDNMTCALCPVTVSTAIEAVPGVKQVQVSLADHTAVVTFDDTRATVEQIAAASTNAGYPARPAD